MSRTWIFGVLTAAVLGAGCLAQAQEPPPGPPPHHGFPGHMGERMEILGFEEMHPGKVVTGAPYSAVRVREEAQTLSDGTAINRKIQTSVFRDSQGRVRREVTMPTIGPLAASNQAQTFMALRRIGLLGAPEFPHRFMSGGVNPPASRGSDIEN